MLETNIWKGLISWSKKNFSELPWRVNRSTYTTFVSEIMLQQTTVGTVLSHFQRFIDQFSQLPELAKASEQNVLLAFQGLGYYRRAKNMHKASQYIHTKLNSVFPQDESLLMEIPGIGPYTARAILSIGMDIWALPVDANLERILTRYYGISIPLGEKLKKHLQELFLQNKILNVSRKSISPRELMEAIMDLGRTYCLAKLAKCDDCPLQKGCFAYSHKKASVYPFNTKNQKQNKKYRIQLIRFIRFNPKGQILVYQRSAGKWLEKQWEVPSFILSSEDPNIVGSQYPVIQNSPQLEIALKKALKFKSLITKYTIENYVVDLSQNPKLFKDFSLEKLHFKRWEDQETHFTSSTHKAVKAIRKKVIHKV